MRTFSSKRLAGLFGLALVAGIALTAVAYAAVTWGPSRSTFTWAHPATYITFNSFTDNPVWGDERFFIKARDVSAGTSTYTNSIKVSDNQELLVTTFFHNNADSSLNLTATGVRAKITLPSGSNSSAEARAEISADNANPTTVFSTMDFTSTSGQPFTLEYVPGSARLITNYVNTSLSDAVVGSGTAIGTSGADGKVQGCAQFSGYVTIRAKVKVTPIPPPTPPTPTPTPTPTPIPTTPVVGKSLPDTGPGSVAAIFAGVSALAGAGHYIVTRRRG